MAGRRTRPEGRGGRVRLRVHRPPSGGADRGPEPDWVHRRRAGVRPQEQAIDERGVEVISPFEGHPGDCAAARRYEIAAALNRLRSPEARQNTGCKRRSPPSSIPVAPTRWCVHRYCHSWSPGIQACGSSCRICRGACCARVRRGSGVLEREGGAFDWLAMLCIFGSSKSFPAGRTTYSI